jgi:hypothetical protein
VILGLLAGCGSATATHGASTVAVHTAGAAGLSTPTSATPAAIAPASCASTVAGTLGTVAARIYHEAATGGNVAQAVHRVQSSATLASAVAGDNASAAREALRSLLLNQIVSIQVLRGGRFFAQAGSGPAIAPVRGSIPHTSASFVLSVQADRTYLQVVRQVTGAQVLLSAAPGAGAHRVTGTLGPLEPAAAPADGPTVVAGKSYQAVSLAGSVYPAGALRISLLVPSSAIACEGTPAQTRVNTLGQVGERVYWEELHSAETSATLRHLEASTAFRRAVAGADVAATRAAILGFFAQHIHVVRVRVTIGSRLLIDEGGPYVLAPVHGTLRSGGRVVGSFTMAIQDDAGYLKLAHLFTGAEVLMRAGDHQVMGTLSPGPASVPARGTVSYRGRDYQAYSFTGEAFPSGPLHLSLLIGA